MSGVFPIGVFLFPHLTTNSAIVWGQLFGKGTHGHAGVEAFQHEVNFIHSLPALILIEIGLLWLPIAYHALMGLYFARTGKDNVRAYGYQDNWRYSLQRFSGYVGVLFIFLHVSSTRWGWDYGGLLPSFEAEHAASTTATHFQQGALGVWFVAPFYLVCVTLLVFHFANGLWTAAITWGLTVSPQAQRRWGYVCAAIGLGLTGAAMAAVAGFTTLDIEKAREVEQRLLTDPHGLVAPTFPEGQRDEATESNSTDGAGEATSGDH